MIAYEISQFLPDSVVQFRSELNMPPIPNLLQGIGRVIVASQNQKKVSGVEAWIGGYHITRGEGQLMVESREVHGDEPMAHDAIRVSEHKVRTLVSQMNGEYGPQSLVVGMDTVHFRDGVSRYNMSRMERLTLTEISEEIESAIYNYSSDGIVAMWDNGITVSRQGLFASTGDCVVARMRKIPSDLIRNHVFNNVATCKQINAVIPIIDHSDFQPYIEALGIFPLTTFVDKQTGELKMRRPVFGGQLINAGDSRFLPLLDVARKAIVNGIPSSESMARIERLSPRERPSARMIV